MRMTKTGGALVASLVLAGLLPGPLAADAVDLPFKPDITVAADGSGDFTTVQKAVESIPATNKERKFVYIKDGVYKEKVRIDAPFVTLIGQSRKGTRLEYALTEDDFDAKPDPIGKAVVNINGSDAVLQNLSIVNTVPTSRAHQFAIYGEPDRIVLLDCDALSQGADTVALGKNISGHYYHARCAFSGAADFLCPRGDCYITDSTFYETTGTASVWQDGSKNKEFKFVLRNCKFDGVEGTRLARHHRDAAFYFLDCTLSANVSDKPPYRVIYPLGDGPATPADIQRNQELDKTNIWGDRYYYYNVHRDGGDYKWFADNLATAPGSPKPEQVTAAWTMGGVWDPELKVGPKLLSIFEAAAGQNASLGLKFSESVTVKGKPRLPLGDGQFADYVGGSGSDLLTFTAPVGKGIATLAALPPAGGTILATQAGATLRIADLTMPKNP